MLASFLLLSAAFQANGASMAAPEVFAEPTRLAATPKLDGKLDNEEWDPLYSDGPLQSFFSWEPGQLHVAAKLPVGQDLVFSLDRDANGWLVGDDNLEVRVGMKDGKPVIHCRLLQASGPAGARWADGADYEKASSASASVDGNTWTAEVNIGDPGTDLLPMKPRTIAIRVDKVAFDAPTPEAAYPRGMTPVNLSFDRTAGLPAGLVWNPQTVPTRVVTPGDSIRIRHTFKGAWDMKLKRVDIRNEGAIKDITNGSGVPFPAWDKKARAYVDYNTDITRDAPFGWYANRVALTADDGVTSLIETSFRIAPLVDFDLAKERILSMDKPRVQRFSYFVQSNSNKRLDGVTSVTPPTGWREVSGSNKGFIIYSSRARIRRTFEVEIPAKVTGAFPFKFTADIGGRIVEQTLWLNVQPPK